MIMITEERQKEKELLLNVLKDGLPYDSSAGKPTILMVG